MSEIRYAQIAAILARRIAEHTYPEGSLLPTEKNLMQEFSCSRHTIRSAMQVLELDGMISRRRGLGTIVQASLERPFIQSLGSLEDLIHLAEQSPRTLYHSTTLTVDIALSKKLQIQAGSHWLKFSSVRTTDQGLPMVYTDVYVADKFNEIQTIIPQHNDRLIAELIEEKFGCRIESVVQDITAIHLPPEIATLLHTPDHSAGLHMLRRYRDGLGSIILASESYHPAERYTFTTTLTRQSGVS